MPDGRTASALTGQVSGPILRGMSDEPDNHELARQIAVLEERMNTHQAEHESALDRLRADIRADMGRLSEGMARRDTEAAKRETRLIVTIAGLMIGISGLAVAFLAFLVGLSG